MQNVSRAWDLASRETLLPEMMVELTHQVTDPGIHEEAVVTGVNANSNSKISTLLTETGETETKYGTLGWNTWGLDGTFDYYDPSYRKESFLAGYYSQFTDPSWATGSEPQIVMTFPEARENVLPGLKITWSKAYNEWASSFRVTAYRGTLVVADTTIEGNTDVESTVSLDMAGYDKIVITILSWSVIHGMARCMNVYLGSTTVLTKDDLLGYTHSQSADLLSAALPQNTITFRLRNEAGQWNPDNPVGSGQYLLNQQEIRVRYGMALPTGIEWIQGGVFWLSEWDVPSNGLEANFTARDSLTFMGESYIGPKTGTLYEIAEAALTQIYLPEPSTGAESYILDSSLKDYSTSFEDDFTVAEILQMVAHAGTCVIFQDRYGTLRIQPWTASYSGFVIDRDISYTHPEYTISKPVRSVSVGYGDDQRVEIVHSARGEVQTVDNKMVVNQNDATRVAEKTLDVLKNRKVISGEYRADLRLDCLDSIIVTSKYSSNIIALTDVEYSTSGGAFRGTYTGRVVSVRLQTAAYHVGEIVTGEV